MHFEDNKPADRQHRKGRASSRQFLKLFPPLSHTIKCKIRLIVALQEIADYHNALYYAA